MNPNGKALLKENKRYYLLDSLRGISTVSMVAFHLCYDIFMMYGLNTSWYFYPMTAVWERSICVAFILLSGMCLNFSGNGIKEVFFKSCGLCRYLRYRDSRTESGGMVRCTESDRLFNDDCFRSVG